MQVYAFRNRKEIEEKSSSGGAFSAIVNAALLWGGYGMKK